jgi:hypothetical protein
LPLEATELPDLRVSENGHYLETVDGNPFFWIGDTGWTLFQKSPDDIETYFQDRREKRFNVIHAMALRTEKDKLPIFLPNHAGELPFSNTNPVELNEAYWRHIDFIV